MRTIGIDVSKDKLNICLAEDATAVKDSVVANNENAITARLKRWCNDDTIVCAEYTGKYIYPLTLACNRLGVMLWVEDPAKIKHFFSSLRGKSDSVDARRIAEYAFRLKDKAVPYVMPSENIRSLRELIADKALLMTDRKKYEAQLKNEALYMSDADYTRKSSMWLNMISAINSQLSLIDSEIKSIIRCDKRIARQVNLLKSIDGVGETIAINMIAVTDGFTKFQNPRQFNCYAGLAPFTYTSGKSIYSKAKVSQRANKDIKSLLYLAALGAATHKKDSEFRDYYARRTAEGKHPLSVLNVIKAKMVARMFAVIRNDREYQREYEYKPN